MAVVLPESVQYKTFGAAQYKIPYEIACKLPFEIDSETKIIVVDMTPRKFEELVDEAMMGDGELLVENTLDLLRSVSNVVLRPRRGKIRHRASYKVKHENAQKSFYELVKAYIDERPDELRYVRPKQFCACLVEPKRASELDEMLEDVGDAARDALIAFAVATLKQLAQDEGIKFRG